MVAFTEDDVYVVSKMHYKLLMEIANSVKDETSIDLKHEGDKCSINGFSFACNKYKTDEVIKMAVTYCQKWNEYIWSIG